MGFWYMFPKQVLGTQMLLIHQGVLFADPDSPSLITGVDAHLIKRFRVILKAIYSGHIVNIHNLES